MADRFDLDAMLAEARRNRPQPSADLFARVLADAAAERSRPAPAAAAPRRRGQWLALAGWLFGGGALAGIGGTAALLAGLAVGLFQPAPVMALTTALFDEPAASVELMPGYDTLLNEVSAND